MTGMIEMDGVVALATQEGWCADKCSRLGLRAARFGQAADARGRAASVLCRQRAAHFGHVGGLRVARAMGEGMVRTMDEKGFRQFLKRAGKKEHVVEGLVSQVRAFEAYLAGKQQTRVEDVGEQGIQDYVETLAQGEVRERMRGLALYYEFVGNLPLARLAGDIREQEIAKTRRAFRLREFRGVSLEEVAQLEAVGIVTVEHMLAAGRTPEARQQLAEQTGVSPQTILELVKLSDLSRLGAVKGVRARLYYDAGLDTPAKFVRWEPEALRQMLAEFVERTGFDGIAPLPKELRNAITKARQLPEAVQYEVNRRSDQNKHRPGGGQVDG